MYVSDNPVLNSQHVLVEAAKAYRNGLPYHVALAGVTSASAELLGLGERVGKVKAGFDADVVVWDADPLALGATPVQVFIDGIPQFAAPVELVKPIVKPIPHLADGDVRVDRRDVEDLVISGITSVLLPGYEDLVISSDAPAHAVIVNGSIACLGACTAQVASAHDIMHLENGYLAPALTAFGSQLGLEEIAAERDTSDGANDATSFSRAVDGLAFTGKNLVAAFSHGVTRAISAPAFAHGGHRGVSAGFRIGAPHALAPHAIFASDVALHYPLTLGTKSGATPSFSSAVGALKAKLLAAAKPPSNSSSSDEDPSVEDSYLRRVLAGTLPLVIDVHSADAIASLLRLKGEVEAHLSSTPSTHNTSTKSKKINLIILGGAESYLLASELAASNTSVILAPVFAYATTWDQRRSLPGAPLSNGTAIDVLLAAGVRVALGVDEDWEARDLYFQAGTVQANSGGRLSDKQAVALAAGNLYEMLGLEEKGKGEFVVFEGSPLTINGQRRVVAGGDGRVGVWV